MSLAPMRLVVVVVVVDRQRGARQAREVAAVVEAGPLAVRELTGPLILVVVVAVGITQPQEHQVAAESL